MTEITIKAWLAKINYWTKVIAMAATASFAFVSLVAGALYITGPALLRAMGLKVEMNDVTQRIFVCLSMLLFAISLANSWIKLRKRRSSDER